MAIIKTFETGQGVEATYHKIHKVEISGEQIVVWVAVYASATAREAGKGQLWMEYVNIPFSALEEDPRIALYPMLQGYYGSYLKGGESDQEFTEVPDRLRLKSEAYEAPVGATE